jgi:RNA polymerase sigma-70 factor (ECF subfamily)
MKQEKNVLGTAVLSDTFTSGGRMSDAHHSPPQTSVGADADSQTRFIQQNLRRVFLLIYRIVGNPDDAQDLTQETFIKALQRQGQLKDLEKSAHWLSRIAANTAIDFLRRSKKYSYSDISRVSDSISSSYENAEQSLLRGERWLHLDGGLATLTERERTALILRDLEDIPADEVASQMNCSMATVRSHIANARAKFKRYLEGRKSF